MTRAPKITRAQAIALPRPRVGLRGEWLAAGVAVVLLLVALLAP